MRTRAGERLISEEQSENQSRRQNCEKRETGKVAEKVRALNGRGSHLLESTAVIAFGAAATAAEVICLLHTVERYKTVRHHIANIVRLLPGARLERYR